jgi:mRNA interferase RelE/StbE
MTTWSLKTTRDFDRSLRKLDRPDARRVVSYLLEAVASADPRSRGAGMSGGRAGYWHYRIGDYRVVVHLEDNRMVVVALDVGHRSTIYRD